ncbi:uncharacterized protein LOC115583266 [Sparus aurata]|uniref:uncharacterized protein LOC115583266 n=1 Tax=Sparus aurata TaxID=8175 RepID=UPI0011C17B25|nr:uncharacterized protein LOC115583266 [Sparus aurata]
MRTFLDLCFCLLTLCGVTPVLYGVKVVVKEDSDAVLPCLINTEEDITGKTFDWKKDGQKEVFFYSNGNHDNNGFTGQDEQFKGRVSHFQVQLMNGSASIKIQNTTMADSGNYSCDFPDHHSQTCNIELVVERILRDRSGEIPENQSREVKLLRTATILLAVLFAVVLLVVAVVCCRYLLWKKHPPENGLTDDSDNDSTDEQLQSAAEGQSSDVTDSTGECLVKLFRKKRVKTGECLVKFFRKKRVKTDEQLQSAAEDQSSDVTYSSCPPDDPVSSSPLNNDGALDKQDEDGLPPRNA